MSKQITNKKRASADQNNENRNVKQKSKRRAQVNKSKDKTTMQVAMNAGGSGNTVHVQANSFKKTVIRQQNATGPHLHAAKANKAKQHQQLAEANVKDNAVFRDITNTQHAGQVQAHDPEFQEEKPSGMLGLDLPTAGDLCLGYKQQSYLTTYDRMMRGGPQYNPQIEPTGKCLEGLDDLPHYEISNDINMAPEILNECPEDLNGLLPSHQLSFDPKQLDEPSNNSNQNDCVSEGRVLQSLTDKENFEQPGLGVDCDEEIDEPIAKVGQEATMTMNPRAYDLGSQVHLMEETKKGTTVLKSFVAAPENQTRNSMSSASDVQNKRTACFRREENSQKLTESYCNEQPVQDQCRPGYTVQEIWNKGYCSFLTKLGLTAEMPVSDTYHLDDPQYVSDVAMNCTKHMLDTEAQFNPGEDCVGENQKELSSRMRSILVSWLIEVHMKYKLLPETLFITVNLIDRYCEKQSCIRKEYQLLGVTAMRVASKYEEIWVPKIEDFVDITDNTYTREEILRQEFQLLTELQFDITFPTSYRFLERFHNICNKASKGHHAIFYLGCYLLELCLVDVTMNKWLPSRIAVSALYLARKMHYEVCLWPKEVAAIARLSEKDVRDTAGEISVLINLAHKKPIYDPIFRKYSMRQYYRVAQIPIKFKEAKKLNQMSTGHQQLGA